MKRLEREVRMVVFAILAILMADFAFADQPVQYTNSVSISKN